MRTFRKIIFLQLLIYFGFTSASIGRFLPFSGFYPIPSKTPEPIDIKTHQTYPFFSIKPLTFKGNNGKEIANLQNNGYQALVTLRKNYTTSRVTGGVLGNDLYTYIETDFLWTNETNSVAYTTVNGKYGSALEVMIIFYNQKYETFTKAKKYRDGLAKILFRIVIGSKFNPTFEPFATAMRKIRKPGQSVPIKLLNVYDWYYSFPPNSKYFVYPGSVVDGKTGEEHYCTTTIVPDPGQVFSFISEEQFENTFLKLRDSNGNPMINGMPQSPRGSRPIARARGILQLPYSSKRYPSNQ